MDTLKNLGYRYIANLALIVRIGILAVLVLIGYLIGQAIF